MIENVCYTILAILMVALLLSVCIWCISDMIKTIFEYRRFSYGNRLREVEERLRWLEKEILRRLD